MKKILLEDALILSAAKTARSLVHLLPLGCSLWVGRRIGGLIYSVNKRKRIAYQNLRAAFSAEKSPRELRAISKRSFENMVMAIVELLKFPDLDRAYIDKHVRILGTEKFKEPLEQKQGLIFLTAHFGNWEILNVAASLLGFPMVALARVQKHPRSDAFLNDLRTSKGNQVIHKGMPVREILRSLKKGKIVGILSDQDGGKNGSFVKFFNRWSSTPSGVATFAMRTNSPIFPVFIFREGATEHRVEVEGPLRMPPSDVTQEEAEKIILQQFADILEQKIRKDPGQWLWAHRRWKSTPNRSVVILSDGKQGHLNQSLAVLEAIKEDRAAKGLSPDCTRSAVIEIRYQSAVREKVFRLFSILFQGRLPFKSKLLQWALSKESYQKIIQTYADIVISCGSSLAGLNLLVTHENNAKSVVVMKPPFSCRRFDLVIAPKHDRLKPGKNIFITRTSPSLVTEEYLKTSGALFTQYLRASNGARRIGLLVGGDTAEVRFSKDYFEKLIQELSLFSVESGSVVLATSSRRTPVWADQTLKRVLSDKTRCPLLVIANESNPPGVVGGILGLSDMIVVSGESMSMVSEAVSSKKPVLVFMPSKETRIKPKHQDFLKALARENLILETTPENIRQALQASLMGTDRSFSLVSEDKQILIEAVKKVTS